MPHKLFAPDKLKPLIPGPPPVHWDPQQDRRNMRQYAQQRYIASKQTDPDYD